MRVLWFTNTILPAAAKEIGIPEAPSGGWMDALLKAMRQYTPDVEFFVLATHRIHRSVTVDGVTYATFGNPRKMVFSDNIPADLEKEVQQLVSKFNPDVIHIHGTEYFYACLSPKALCHKPVLVSLQGIINGLHPYYNGNLSPLELAPYRTLRNRIFQDGVFENQRRWALERSTMERKSLSYHQHYAGRTAWDKALLLKFNPKATYHHLDEIMRPEFYTNRHDFAKIRRYSIFCSAAASYPLKGLHWLLRAAAILKPRYPDIQIRIANAQKTLMPPQGLIAWLKDCDYPAYLRHLIRELDLQENVVGLPALTTNEVATELQKAHVFCLPSLCENSPNSLAEAMLIGTPSVAVKSGGVPSILEHEKEGLLCPAADHNAIADSIGLLFANKKLAERYVTNARKTVLERHNSKRVADMTWGIYEKICGNE